MRVQRAQDLFASGGARDQVIAAAQDHSVQTADVFRNRHRRIDPPLGIG